MGREAVAAAAGGEGVEAAAREVEMAAKMEEEATAAVGGRVDTVAKVEVVGGGGADTAAKEVEAARGGGVDAAAEVKAAEFRFSSISCQVQRPI